MIAARIAFDPGIGFGKALAVPGDLGSTALADREWPTVALTSLGRAKGANVIRVHSVRPNVEALRMTEAILPSEAA